MGEKIKYIIIVAIIRISTKPSNRELYMPVGVIFVKVLLRDPRLFNSAWKYVCILVVIKLEMLNGKL
jgi:hypothetical protein